MTHFYNRPAAIAKTLLLIVICLLLPGRLQQTVIASGMDRAAAMNTQESGYSLSGGSNKGQDLPAPAAQESSVMYARRQRQNSAGNPENNTHESHAGQHHHEPEEHALCIALPAMMRIALLALFIGMMLQQGIH